MPTTTWDSWHDARTHQRHRKSMVAQCTVSYYSDQKRLNLSFVYLPSTSSFDNPLNSLLSSRSAVRDDITCKGKCFEVEPHGRVVGKEPTHDLTRPWAILLWKSDVCCMPEHLWAIETDSATMTGGLIVSEHLIGQMKTLTSVRIHVDVQMLLLCMRYGTLNVPSCDFFGRSQVMKYWRTKKGAAPER